MVKKKTKEELYNKLVELVHKNTEYAVDAIHYFEFEIEKAPKYAIEYYVEMLERRIQRE